MISKTEIENFNKKFDTVSVFIECDGEILLLHRQDYKPQGNTWSLVAGKVNQNENLQDALIREVEEETGIRINQKDCNYFGKYYVRFPEYDFVYNVFHLSVEEKPKIKLKLEENKNYQWIKPQDALKLNLIQHEDYNIKCFYSIK
jgi:8-oxo-dGTP diphosphatase